jgi:GPH family glycoside/pentoside/hexuronide:cation symporter
MFFSILGSLVAFTVPLLLIPAFEPASASRVLLMGVVFGVLSAVPLVLVFLGTVEREVYQRQRRPALLGALRTALRNKPFVYGLLIFLATWISVVILQDTLLYYIKHVVERESESEVIMATVFVVAMLALPIWNWAARRWGKRWAYVGGIAFWAVVQMVLITLTSATGLGTILLLCVLAGIGVAAAHVLPWAILPDAVEWGEFKTGERNEGMLYSLVTLCRKVATSIAIPGTLLLLEITGYDGLADRQPASALLGIRVVIGPIPAALLGLGILFALLYPLTREKHAEVVRILEARRATTRE